MLTAAGAAHMADLQDRRETGQAEAHAGRVGEDLTRIAPGDIVFSKTLLRDGQPRAGCVVHVEYDRDTDGGPPAVKTVTFVEFISDELCDVCGATNTRRPLAKVLRIFADDIADLHPRNATGMHGWACRLARLAAERGFDRQGIAYWTWAGMLANQAGILGDATRKPRGR